MNALFATGLLLLRLTLGLIFMAHGSQKLFGLFGGRGLHGAQEMMSRLGLQPAPFWGLVVALGEFGGGLLVALGLLTPLAVLLPIGSMLVAIAKVHWSKGFWNGQGGFEFNLTLIMMAVVLGLLGPGTFSLDTLLNFVPPQPWTFVIGLVVLVVLLLILIPLSGLLARHMQQPAQSAAQ
jgi:putative oxidoreductase